MARLAPLAAVLALLSSCSDGTSGAPRCSPSTDGSRIQLVDHALWEVAASADDPFAAFRPADDIGCPAGAREIEDFSGTPSFAIETDGCPYTTMVQPLQADVCAGDAAYVWLWHFELTAPTGAEAHVALHVGDHRLWERTLSIPSASGLFTDDVIVDRDLPAGTPVFLHVRNHGSNAYNLLELSLKR